MIAPRFSRRCATGFFFGREGKNIPMNRLQELVSAPNGINRYEVNFIRIDSYRNREMQGAFYSPYCKKSAPFSSELEFLKLLNQWMDSKEIPQSTTRLRKFSKRTNNRRSREESPVKHPSQDPRELLTTAGEWNLQEQPEGSTRPLLCKCPCGKIPPGRARCSERTPTRFVPFKARSNCCC